MEVSDARAIENVLAGNPDEFRLLVDRHSRTIFKLGYRMTGSEHDADDVVQETFIRAYRQLASFESRANFGTWLHRIAANCALDLLKSRKRREGRRRPNEEDPMLETMPSNDPDPHRLLGNAELRDAVERAMNTLSENERTAFVLRHFEGMSIDEIGNTLGTKVNATKNTIFRAVQKLRDELGPMVRTAS